MIQRHLISTYFVHLFIVSIIFLSKNGKTFAAVLSLILKSLCVLAFRLDKRSTLKTSLWALIVKIISRVIDNKTMKIICIVFNNKDLQTM